MSSATQSPNVFFEPTSGGVSFFKGLFERVASTSSAPQIMQFTQERPTERHIELDDLLTDLCAETPALTAAVEEGRKWVARTYYAEEGETIRTLRLNAGLSQAALASRMGTSQSYVAKLEKGDLDAGLKTIERLADALGIPPTHAFELALAQFKANHEQI